MNIWAGAGLLSLAGALRGPGMHPKMMAILCFPCVFNVFWQEIGAQEGVMEAIFLFFQRMNNEYFGPGDPEIEGFCSLWEEILIYF